MMRRQHNPNGVTTVPRENFTAVLGPRVLPDPDLPPLVPCVDCGVLVDAEGEPPYRCLDCTCIWHTGVECDWRD